DEELPILDADVHVRPEDEQLLREILQILLHADVPLERRDLLSHPVGEWMRPRGRDLEPTFRREVDDRTAQPHELRAEIRRTATHLASDFYHRLVKLRLHLLEDEVIAVQNLGDIRTELACGGIDYLVLFLDAKSEARCAHVTRSWGARRDDVRLGCLRAPRCASNGPISKAGAQPFRAHPPGNMLLAGATASPP